MNNFQNSTYARSADGRFLIEIPRSVFVNPTLIPREPAAPIGHGGVGGMVRDALMAFDTATQVPQMLVGLDRW